MFMLKVILAIVVVGTAQAECPNACSGHGSCGQFDQCECCMNWQGEDCSRRTCPFDQAWADTPLGDLDGSATTLWSPMSYTGVTNLDGFPTTENWPIIAGSTTYPFGTYELFPNSNPQEGHFYAECSSKGVCNRDDGVCACFAGFEGTACQRMICPNKCSGHGICSNVKTLAQKKEVGDGYKISDWSGIGGLYYQLWDRVQVMGCQCDSLYAGPDCSLKKCPLGVDPLYRGSPLYEEAYVDIYGIYTVAQAALGVKMDGHFDLVIYDNLGTEYVLDGLRYCDQNTDSTATVKQCTQPAAIMAYFANKRLQDTTVGVTTYYFVSIQKLPTYSVSPPAYGVRYWFNYKKGNPGYHKDLYVKSFTPVIQAVAANPSHQIYHYVVQQGMDCDYIDMYNEAIHQTNNQFPYLLATNPSSSGPFDPTNYNLILPGYVYNFNAATSATSFLASTDLSFWIGNPTFTVAAGTTTRTYHVPSDKMKTPAIRINGFYFLVSSCTGFGGNNWMTSNGLTPLAAPAGSLAFLDANLYSFTTLSDNSFVNGGVIVQTISTGPSGTGGTTGWTETPYSAPNIARLLTISPTAFPGTAGFNTIMSFYSTVTVFSSSTLTTGGGPYKTQVSGAPATLAMALVDQSGLATTITAGLDSHLYDRRYPITARLTPQYNYVTHCAGRGTCNTDSGLCECFSGYKTAVCDTQAPQC